MTSSAEIVHILDLPHSRHRVPAKAYEIWVLGVLNDTQLPARHSLPRKTPVTEVQPQEIRVLGLLERGKIASGADGGLADR